LTNYLETEGLRLAGRASGHNALRWPRGRFADRAGEGRVAVTAPSGVTSMTRELPMERVAARFAESPGAEPFSNHTPREPVPVEGEISYSIEPGWVNVAASHLATPETYVAFEGRTAYGEESKIPFHVSSLDWQESDRLLAGILTAFGARTAAIPIGGYGTFDGVMLNQFRRPRIEGRFAGERMRAWDVEWGTARGDAVIENNYVDAANVIITSGESSMQFDGRFSAGFPRRDGGEEMNARIRVINRPVADLRHAFNIDTYRVDGKLSGEFHVFGPYQRPLGFGNLSLTDGSAYGETFETAIAALRFEGEGVRLDNIQVSKEGGRATGAAFVSWTSGSYSFNLDARDVPVESVALARNQWFELSGLLDFSAGGSGTFDQPRYTVKGTVRDLFAGDEGIGQLGGEITLANNLVTLRVEAASPRLAVSSTGRIELTPGRDVDMLFRVTETSLDPYVRMLVPRLSPYTTAIASGSIHVTGQLSDVDRLIVETIVDDLDLRLFDYKLRNAVPLKMVLDKHVVRLADVRLAGEDTALEVSGTANLHDDQMAVRVRGDANLGILQGFSPNIRASGRATLEGALTGKLAEPLVTGTMTAQGGRIRHYGLPHALENILGPIRFDSRAIRLDDLSARLGGGPVQFGGSIGIDGYRLGQIDVTMKGEQMRLRFPKGMSSLADAALTLRGTTAGATLSGQVQVRDGVYSAPINTGGSLLDFTSSATTALAGPAESTTSLPLRYDIQISAPSTLQVRNNSIRLTARADFQLRGTYDRPLLLGRADVERGEVAFEGRRYVVTRGAIDLSNPTRIEPFFDLETETRVRVPGETYRVTLQASGTLDRLNLAFNSDPWLPQVEILALLFSDVAPGRDVEFRQYSTDITPQQQLLRERAARALAGPLSSEVGRVVEQTFGVDTFQLTPSLVDPNAQSSRLDPGARLTLGKRISDRFYLTYARSLSSSTRDQIIMLEYDQTDRYSWILSRNEDGTYAVEARVRHVF
jgi:translocation and assembly module TamB